MDACTLHACCERPPPCWVAAGTGGPTSLFYLPKTLELPVIFFNLLLQAHPPVLGGAAGRPAVQGGLAKCAVFVQHCVLYIISHTHPCLSHC